MPKFTSVLTVALLLLAALTAESQAGWKKRGWYVKKPGADCVMRNVAVPGAYGKVVTRKVRVCR